MNLKLPYNRELEVINIKYLYNDNIKYLISVLGNLQSLHYIIKQNILLFEQLYQQPVIKPVINVVVVGVPKCNLSYDLVNLSYDFVNLSYDLLNLSYDLVRHKNFDNRQYHFLWN